MDKQNDYPVERSSTPFTMDLTTAANTVKALHALQQQACEGSLDIERANRASKALFGYYIKSAEAATLRDPLEGPRMLAVLAAEHLETTLTALNSYQLEILLFYIIPEQVAASPEKADNIIRTLRALYVWLDREFTLDQAEKLVELLGDDATYELEQRMNDPDNFCQAKARAIEAIASGIDPSDPQAIDRFIKSRISSRLYPDHFGSTGDFNVDGFNPSSAASTQNLTPQQLRTRQKKRKSDRKATRKARKKNR